MSNRRSTQYYLFLHTVDFNNEMNKRMELLYTEKRENSLPLFPRLGLGKLTRTLLLKT